MRELGQDLICPARFNEHITPNHMHLPNNNKSSHIL
jgi:hypothetical protein